MKLIYYVITFFGLLILNYLLTNTLIEPLDSNSDIAIAVASSKASILCTQNANSIKQLEAKVANLESEASKLSGKK